MSEFKVGDLVKRGSPDSEVWAEFARRDPGPYKVTSIEGRWVQINGYVTDAGQNIHPFVAQYFKLVERDDPLPPAPESVRYNEGTYGFPFEVKSLRANEYHPNRIRLGVLCGDRLITHKYVVIDPDAALQLAHDLTRMAMEIKRKEKQNA